MPRKKYEALLRELRASTLFTFRFVESIVGEQYAKVLIHNLKRRGEVIEVLKGVYSFKKSPYLVAKALPKAYVGLSTAAFLHSAWNQVPAVVVLSPCVSSRARGGVREVAGYKVVLKKISEKMYFGYEYVHIEELDELVRVSTPEKTLIDLIYFRHPALDELLPNLLQISDPARFREYLLIMRERGVRGWKVVKRILREAGCEL